MDICRAGVNDIENLTQMRIDFLDSVRPMTEQKKQILKENLPIYFNSCIASDEHVALLGEVDGEIVASVFMSVEHRMPSDLLPDGKLGFIFNVFTYPQHRGKGYAAKLMGEVAAIAKDMGLGLLELQATPAGRGLYEKLGYTLPPTVIMRYGLQEKE